MKYVIEIYLPSNGYDSFVRLESESPFQTISSGDLIDPRSYNCNDDKLLLDSLLRVISIQHVIPQTTNNLVSKHHVNIFTEYVPNREETVLGKSL